MLRERILPADFRSKANRRKRGLRMPARPREAQPAGRSLDSSKQVATSEKPQTFHEWNREQEDYLDRRKKAWVLYTGLLETLKQLVWLEEETREFITRRITGGQPVASKPRKSRVWRAAKDFERISGCQSEWVGYAPQCGQGRIVSVPVNCNHRLCPLCNASRAERYRKRVQALFSTLANPQLLTLTVPSPRFMDREVLDTLRTRLKAFLKQHKGFLLGGVYSIEVTYNRRKQTWHPHVHILVDVAGPAGRINRPDFDERRRRLEFAWLVLTQGKRRKGERTWTAKDYDLWADWVKRGAIGQGDGRNRRVIDIRPVTRDRKAAYEVLKYMAKAASFIGEPGALKQLLLALRGVRQIQTFGTCYNFTLDEEEKPTDGMACDCGCNTFVCVGRLALGEVELDPKTGRWYVREDGPAYERLRSRGHTTCTT